MRDKILGMVGNIGSLCLFLKNKNNVKINYLSCSIVNENLPLSKINNPY
jgi:hypothetical protein